MKDLIDKLGNTVDEYTNLLSKLEKDAEENLKQVEEEFGKEKADLLRNALISAKKGNLNVDDLMKKVKNF